MGLKLEFTCERCKESHLLDYELYGTENYFRDSNRLYEKRSPLSYTMDEDAQPRSSNPMGRPQTPAEQGKYFVHPDSKYCRKCEDIVVAAREEAAEKAADEAEMAALVIK